MKKRMLSTILGLLLIAALGGSFLTAWQEVQAQGPWEPRAPLGTAFTYQGRLLDGGTPVEGNCDFRFSLYDVATGGTPIAGPVTASTVPVTDGYFGAEIDFGADAFDGSARYLGIEVLCPSGTGSYVAMTSRVALSPTPYALNAAGAPWAGLTGLPAGFDDDVDDVDDTVSWAEISGIVGAVANTVAAGDHDHDATYAPLGHTHDDRYYTETELSTNTAAQVHWDNLTNVPSDLSDGDDDTTYSAGTGLSLVGTTFHVVTSTIQARVSGTCPAGSSIRVIDADGTVTCETDDVDSGTGGGDITAVYAGDGLTGGGISGDVTVAVNFAGSGTATTVARSDHNHTGVYSPVSHTHDDRYYTETELSTDTTAQVHWGNLSSVPTGLADGDDDTLGSLSCGSGQIAEWNGSAWACAADDTGSGDYWSLSGNAGTTPGTHFVGTTDNQALELHVYGGRVLRLEPTSSAANLIGGYSGNSVTSGAVGATIGGGGDSGNVNRVTDDYGTASGGYGNIAGDNGGTTSDHRFATVGGGMGNYATGPYSFVGGGTSNQATGNSAAVVGGAGNIASGTDAAVGGGGTNTASGEYATVAGGAVNTASGNYSFAAGHRAQATDLGAFVWADSTNANFSSTASNQFAVRATGGVRLETGGAGLTVDGHAVWHAGNDGSGSTLNADLLDGVDADGFWRLGGNAVVADSVLGTTGNYALDVRVYNARALRLEPNTTSPNLIGGYSGNNVMPGAYGAAIGGGGAGGVNRVTDDYGTVGGGGDNQAGDNTGTTSDHSYATVGGGFGNTASAQSSTVGGGSNNGAVSVIATIGGGNYNYASGYGATIGGGMANQASGAGAVVGGGGFNGTVNSGNEAHASASTIGGGWSNYILDTASYATIAGGYNITVTGQYAAMGGGADNWASGGGSTIAGGYDNVASNVNASVGGGQYNDAGGEYATVSGGRSNTASSSYSAIGGGVNNQATSGYATVGGGYGNEARAGSATIGGGQSNEVSQAYGTIAGGYNITVTGEYATVGGGWNNTASGDYTTIGGGWSNYIASAALYGTIAGGNDNTASAQETFVGGGIGNQATVDRAVVVGGYYNTASNNVAAVGGGAGNVASGQYSTVPGGNGNSAAGNFSLAAGNRAKANSAGCFVWGDSTAADVTCGTDNRTIFRSSGGYYIYTNSGLTSGAYLAAGSGSWTNMSDRNMKENFAPIDTQDVLARLAEIEISTWNYTTEDPAVRHMGPMAQDFYAAFGLGDSERHITSVDADGVALAAVQGLYERSLRLEAENAALRAENDAQQTQIDDLLARVEALEGAGGAAPRSLGSWSTLGFLVACAGLGSLSYRSGLLERLRRGR